MSENIKIKICGMRDPANIQEISSLNPDLLGLIFYPKSKRFVTNEMADEIISSIPENIKKTGVFVNEDLKVVQKKINLFKLDYIQIHGNESPEYCQRLMNNDVKIIKAFGVDDDFDFSKTNGYYDFCDYFLFDTKSKIYGGTGNKFNWDILKSYNNKKPVLLSGGLGPDDAEEIKNLNFLNIFAIDLNSKFEIEPALKDFKLLNKFLEDFRKN